MSSTESAPPPSPPPGAAVMTAVGCPGLRGGCPDCRRLYIAAIGDGGPGQCLLCDARHWPWDSHAEGMR
jgi:hypothetical protein